MLERFSRVQRGVKKKIRHFTNSASILYKHIGQEDSGHRYVFHHLPKCGGTSAFDALSEWFICIKDYPPPWSDLDNPGGYKKFCDLPKNLGALRDYHMLCGHYHLEGSFLYERYPGIMDDERYRLITFLRHPLEIQLSLYYYEQANGRFDSSVSVEERLLLRSDYLASILPCDKTNFHKVLDRYFFIGAVETYQQSFDALAEMLEKPMVSLGLLNRSSRDGKKLSREFLSEFEEKNSLDYQIYNYAVGRFMP